MMAGGHTLDMVRMVAARLPQEGWAVAAIAMAAVEVLIDSVSVPGDQLNPDHKDQNTTARCS